MKEIDPTSIVMVLAGIPITGVADGTFVEVEHDEDAYTHHVGGQGTVTRVKNANQMGTVTFTLGQATITNDLLSALAIRDRNNGTGVGALTIKDLKGTTMYRSQNAWLRKLAKGEHGKEHTNRAWVVTCERLEAFVGGSTTPNSL